MDRGIESACRAYHRRQWVAHDLEADRLAGEALQHRTGSPEWRAAVDRFADFVNQAEAKGIKLCK